jgi:GntR family transcriptional repressor for pyruvate dehydrogenase complex
LGQTPIFFLTNLIWYDKRRQMSNQLLYLLNPIKMGKVSERIVQQIKSIILEGALSAGDRLPPERQLVEKFGASRISVREAIKNLEALGLIVVKPGSGTFVAEINSKPLSESLSAILRIKKTSIIELTEARIIIEPSVAKLACEKATPEDLQMLDKNIQTVLRIIQTNTTALWEDIEFHCLLAEATHNAVISITVKTMLNVVEEMTENMTRALERRIEISENAVRYHEKILDAFYNKDTEGAKELMLNHIVDIQNVQLQLFEGTHREQRRRGKGHRAEGK